MTSPPLFIPCCGLATISFGLCYLISVILFSEICCGTAQQVTLQAYDNAAFVGMPIKELLLEYDSAVYIPGMVSARIMGSIRVRGDDATAVPAAAGPGGIYVDCATQNKTHHHGDNGSVPSLFWLDDHLVCQSGFYSNDATAMGMDGAIHNPILSSSRRKKWVLYGEFWPKNERFSLTDSVADIRSIPRSVTATESIFHHVRPSTPPLERQRNRLAQELQKGWGLYNHNSLQEAILLPDGIRMKWEFCRTADCSSCDRSPRIPATVRPLFASSAPSTNNVDTMQYEVAYPAENVVLRVTHLFHPNDRLIVQFQTIPIGPAVNKSKSNNGYLRISGDVAYFPARSGSVTQSTPMSITVSATGLRQFTFCANISADLPLRLKTNTTRCDRESNMILVPLAEVGHSVTVNGFNSAEIEEDECLCKARQFQDKKNLHEDGGGDGDRMPVNSNSRYFNQVKTMTAPRNSRLATVARGIDAAIYFNLIYTPVERTLVVPVSRGWGKSLCMPALLPEFEYVLFDWDNVLVAYMMGMRGGKDLAYASLIQVVRSRTAKGFIPNFSAGGAKSQDRTEPPLAATVLLELMTKFDDAWIAEYLWDDLAIQMDWFWSNRRLDDFVVLGSDPVPYPNAHGTGTMQGARFESGLDDSPMYDGDFFKDGIMQLYDVGMTSLVLKELESLISLANRIGKDVDDLKHRARVLRNSLKHLWDPVDGIYTNTFPNGTLYRRRSPTSFYPLLSKVATDAQVEHMVEHWLTNATRFCVGHRTPNCWWGLPSISADDPAFPKLGYWRGYVWGPMSLLVYWALDNYRHLPQVESAKRNLADQMSDMFLHLWEKKGRVCENYSPHRDDGGDCTGDKFYHWGALAGLLALLESDPTIPVGERSWSHSFF